MAASKSQYYSGFDPRQLSNCQLWLDGADFSSFTFSTGSNITIWRDKSGNARDASAISVPTRATSPTGLTGVFLNGSTNFVGSIANTSNVLTAFVVADMSASTVNNGRLLSLARAGGDDFGNALDCACIIRNQSLQNIQTFRANLNLSVVSVSYDTPFVGTALFTGASNTDYRNGVAGTTLASSGNFGYTLYGLGNYPRYIGVARWSGYVYEVILYNQALGSNDRQAVEGYLAWKWRLNTSLLSNHAFRRAPTVMRPFAPSDISGNILWLDGADYRSTDISSTSSVTVWYDKSGCNYNANATQPIVATKPSFANSGGLTFTSTNSNFLNIAVPWTENVTIYMVSTTSTAPQTYFFSRTGGAGGGPAFIQNYTGSSLEYYDSTNRATFSTTPVSPFIAGVTRAAAGGSLALYYFGSNVANLTSATSGTSNWVTVGCAELSNSTVNHVNGTIYELLFYNRVISPFERQRLEGYLAWKWRRQANLAVTHPFKTYYPLTASFNPLLVSNCALWLDAADPTTITTSGTNVTTWADKSGNARNATATSNWPTFTSGNNYIQFSGANWFSYPATFLSNTQYTLFFSVARDVSKAEHTLTSSGTGGSANTNLITGYSPNMYTFKYSYFANDTSFTAPAFTTLPEPPTVITLQQTATQRLAWYNGSQALTNANSTLLISQDDGLLGVFQRTPSTAWNGKWHEILMFNRALTTTERQQIEGYLAWKWDVAPNLIREHPFRKVIP